MRKFINIIKIPVCAASFVVVLVFSILLICLNNQPCGNIYTATNETFNYVINRTLTFEKTTYTQTTVITNKVDSEYVFYYEIKDGNLYSSLKEDDQKELVGTIDAFKLNVTLKTDKFPFPVKVALTCEQNVSNQTMYTAMIISFGVLFVGSGLLVLFVKKHPKQKQVEQPAE